MSKGGVEAKDFTWYVQDAKKLYANEVSVRSPTFSTKLKGRYSLYDEVKWRLLMTTVAAQDVNEKGKNCENSEKRLQSSSPAKVRKVQERIQSKQYIALYVQYVTQYFDRVPILKVTFSICNRIDGIIYSKSKNIFNVITGQHCGFSDFISIDDLNKMKLKELIIYCNFSEVEIDFKNKKALRNNKLTSDIDLHISGKKIPAHKMVLALNIPYFREKFAENDCMTSIEIQDTEFEVFRALLKYVYTGKVSCENFETGKLYIAAIKYKVDGNLKSSCFEIMKTNSKGDELIQILIDCLKEGGIASDLLNLAVLCAEYIAKNKKIILNDYFRSFVKTAPFLLFYTLQQFSSKQDSSEWAIKMKADTLAMSDLPLAIQSSQQHLETYLNNEFLSDIEIQVNDKKYFAHKLTLASRSPVFKRVFSNNMSETISGVVKIEDIESQVFYELLRFLYTNEFENRDDTVEEILIAANKYEIDDLKSICEQILMKKVNTENCWRVVRFADDHNAERLTKFCLYYIIIHQCLPGYFCTYMWELAESHPHFFLEMLNIIYRASGGV